MTRKKYVSVGLSLLVLAGVIIGTAGWSKAFFTSVQNYRSPVRDIGLSPQAGLVPQSAKVVVVLISGLGYDDSLALGLPALEQLRQAGADMAVESTPPTYSQTAWATLITGA